MTTEQNYRRIWQTVRRIPRGKVASYGQVAAAAGLPRRARLVGRALNETPDGFELPWHRVLNARGEISLPKGSESAREQKRRLRAEGVAFTGNRVNWAQCRWRERSHAPVLD